MALFSHQCLWNVCWTVLAKECWKFIYYAHMMIQSCPRPFSFSKCTKRHSIANHRFEARQKMYTTNHSSQKYVGCDLDDGDDDGDGWWWWWWWWWRWRWWWWLGMQLGLKKGITIYYGIWTWISCEIIPQLTMAMVKSPQKNGSTAPPSGDDN